MSENGKCLTIAATMENLDWVLSFFEKQLETNACPKKVRGQILVSLEEIYVNIVNYAYENEGQCSINMDIKSSDEGEEMTLTITDKGKQFDPLKRADPDITLSAEQRQIGGLGIYMVKKSMDSVSYRYESGCNILTLCKKWSIE